ncbi:transposase [Streptomyces sp. NBC_01306]|uniref:transposase n=1 Tax=Streptomyces sp. NBC_01306 TaxID=2903819 RepID=UPI00225B96A6|nr:transposase [Streptomyces sp. NBC_01306]MCX4725619.1 transposase [Streptomyces sp. NBC_01306]
MHLLRNAFRLAACQDGDEIAKALKPIYTAPTEDTALERFAAFAEFWGKKYPAIIRPWENAWEEFTPVLRFGTSFGSVPPSVRYLLRFHTEIRRIVCTTSECGGDVVRGPRGCRRAQPIVAGCFVHDPWFWLRLCGPGPASHG